MHFFENSLQSINRYIATLEECAPVFNIRVHVPPQQKQHNIESEQCFCYVIIDGKAERISQFNLLPSGNVVNKQEAEWWRVQMICYVAANRDVRLAKEFFEDTDIIAVFKQYIIVKSDSCFNNN